MRFYTDESGAAANWRRVPDENSTRAERDAYRRAMRNPRYREKQVSPLAVARLRAIAEMRSATPGERATEFADGSRTGE